MGGIFITVSLMGLKQKNITEKEKNMVLGNIRQWKVLNISEIQPPKDKR